MRLILASQSPSRASILRGAGVEPVLEPADIDERSLEASLAGHPPADIVAALASAKAEKVAERYPTEPVIGRYRSICPLRRASPLRRCLHLGSNGRLVH